MSDLLNKASLVMVPSGYKEDTVFSVVPSDGSGDLSFTRASNGTRINSAGLVEVCPWNLTDYSEDFSNAVWTKARVTITANDTTAPNGTTTADKVSLNSGTNSKLIQQAYIQNGAFTQTVYAKAGTHNFMQLLVGSDSTPYCNFDLVNGTYSASGCTASITSVGNGWFYLTMSYSTTIGTDYYLWAVDSLSSARADSTSSTGYYYVWGFQLNIGSSAKPYFPTTDRLNVPRLTYQNGGGGCPSLLLEKQSTNLILQSEDFTNASWGINAAATRTANTAISPDGTQNADSIGANGGTTASIYQNISASGSGSYSVSVYAKKNTNRYFKLVITGGASNSQRYGIIVDLQDGSFVTALNTSTALTNTSYSIISAGNGWYRIAVTATVPSSSDVFIVLDNTNSSSNATNATTLDYISPSVGNSYYWGAQGEASSYPTSYIPTTSSSATRVADACFKTGISSLIGQTEGTIFYQIQRNNTDNDSRLQISDGTTNNWLFVSIESGLVPRLYCNVGGVNQFSVYGSSVDNGFHKVALAYKNNDFKVYIDGVASITQTSGSVPTCSVLSIANTSPTNDVQSPSQISQAILFPTRLTNAELASLTTI